MIRFFLHDIFVCEAGIEVPFSCCVINAANCSLKSQETCSITQNGNSFSKPSIFSYH